jgi:hypothetical protein
VKKQAIIAAARELGLHVAPVDQGEAEALLVQCDWGHEFCRRQPVVFLGGDAYCDRHAAAVIAMFREAVGEEVARHGACDRHA